MIAKTRDDIIAAVGLLLAVVSLTLAVICIGGFTVALWGAVFGGPIVKPLTIGLAAFALAVFTRFLAELDKYEFVPAPPARKSTGRGRTVRKATS